MSNRSRSGGQANEVEELLRAAEDEMLLNLTLNSHMSRGSAVSSYIDPDLDRRFQALKSSKSSSKPPITRTVAPPPPPQIRADKVVEEEEDDLFARFAALKGSLPFPSSSSSANCRDGDDYSSSPPNRHRTSDECGDQGKVDNNGIDEDEVQKVIRWAMDAARLDLSSANDGTDDDDDSDGDDDDFGDDDDNYAHRMKSEKKRPKK